MTIPEKEMLRQIESAFSSAIADTEEGSYGYIVLCQLALSLSDKIVPVAEVYEFLDACGTREYDALSNSDEYIKP